MNTALPTLPSLGFDTIATTYEWLRRNGLTLEDAERTILRAAGTEGRGTNEIVRAFLDEHGISLDHEDHVRQLVTFFAHLGFIERVGFNRLRSTLPPDTVRILAVVSVPPNEVEAIRPYIWRGRAAWVSGGGG